MIANSITFADLTVKNKKKICHISSVHFAMDTRIFYRMCMSLKKEYEVDLIAVHPPQTEQINGVNIIPFKRLHNKPFRILFGWLLMFFKAIKRNASIYHIHDPELIPCGLLLRLLGKKVILDIHENIAEDLFDKPWIKNQQMVYKIFHFFEKLACKYFYILLAEKSYEKRYKKLAKNWSTVLNYCDVDFFEAIEKNRKPQSKLKLFYIGIVLENRGILQIIETVKKLKDEGYQAEFHCVGELYSDLRSKIHSLPYYEELEQQLFFHGRKNLEDGYALSEEMDIGMCIIWPMSNSVESYPTKLFEYMSIGLPIITSNFPLYREIVEGNGTGICVDPKDTEEMKKAILSIHMDVKKSELMGKNGKKAVKEKYNWKSEELVLIGVYKSLSN
jgi:glycosyltransferase involved in cell wall biosynthesis